MVPQRPDRARQRAGDRRPLRALRHAGRGAPARAVVLPHHRLRRPPARRPRRRSSGPARQDDAAQLDRALGGRRGRRSAARSSGIDYPVFTTRPDTLFGATFFVMAPEHPTSFRLAAGTEHEEEVHELRQPRADRDRRGARRRRQPKTGVPLGRTVTNPVNGERDPDVRRRLRADGVRHRRDHGRAGARRARLRLRAGRSGCRSGRVDRPGRRGRTSAAVHGRRRAGQLRPDSTGMHEPRGQATQIVDWLDREGRGHALGQLPPARLAALAPALLGLPDPDRLLRRVRDRAGAGGPSCRSSCPTSRTTRRRAARRWPRPRTGSTRRARAAAARRGARPTRWTRSSTRPGTSCATATPTTTRRAWDPEVVRLLDAGRPVHRRRRARDPAPDVRALLHEGARRHGAARASRSRSRGCSRRA